MNKLNPNLKQSLFWLVFIIVIILWLRLDINYNSASPLENTCLGTGSTLLLDNQSSSGLANVDRLSSNFPSLFIGLGQIIGTYHSGRIISIIFSIITLFFFYKFSKILMKDTFAILISVIFFSIQSTFIFISKQATGDIIAITFFTGFLWIGTKILLENKSSKIILIVIAAILLYLSIISNYLLLIYLIPMLILLPLKNRKTFFIFTISFSLLLIFSLLLFDINPISNFYLLFTNKPQSASIIKIFIRLAEYLAIPYMIFVAAIQYRWKTELKKSLINILLSMSLIIPLYLLINQDSLSIWRTLSIALIFISPICGFVISRFLSLEGQYKYASIFLFFFIALMSIWQVNKLEESYPNTKSLVKFMSKMNLTDGTFYSEDAFFPLNNLSNIAFQKEIYLPTTLTKKLDKKEKENIIINIQSAKFDYVIINGLTDIDFYSQLKNDVLPLYYNKIFISKYNCTKAMYENNDGEYLIYKLKKYYRSLRKSVAILK